MMSFRLRWLRGWRFPHPSAVPDNWRVAVDGALEVMARRYALDAVARDLWGDNRRFAAFKSEFFVEVAKRL